MEEIYSTAKIPDSKNVNRRGLTLEPDITELLISSRDPQELKRVWIEWRKATGERIKSLFPVYVELSNRAARLNNFSDNAANWLDEYETENFTGQIGKLERILITYWFSFCFVFSFRYC